ncbi:Hypothetical predicted protein [Pelobates cultripes]|uniref:Uncharacterized protein n=1 Tax=Pelobates cultripes TaxID=61616 RepID=A0AAD1RHC8_PELCU|nr:Hypothetical predicted protein [Pelobates cultripes]
MAFPNVKAYYQAAVLTSLLSHLIKDKQPQWVVMENRAIRLFQVPNLLWLHKKNRPTTPTMPSQLALALQVWETHRTHFETGCPLSMATPIEAITYCIPTFHATPWKEKGITHLSHVCEAGKLMDFTRLRAIYDIPQTSQYSHIPLKSLLGKQSKVRMPDHRDPVEISAWEKIRISGKTSPKFKPLSDCYKVLQTYTPLHKSPQAANWHLDLETKVPEGTWKHIISSTRKLIKSAPLLEQHQKTLYRWYMVPTRIHKQYPHSSPLCWRCTQEQEQGTVMHIWWRCPQLARFWKKVHKLIKRATNTDINFEPATFLLLNFPNVAPAHKMKLICHVLLTAQKLIARSWKYTKAPNIQTLIQEIDKQLIYETYFIKTHPRPQRFLGTWELWHS